MTYDTRNTDRQQPVERIVSAHTPGPWIAQKDPNAISRDDWCIGVENAPIDYVATCSERDAHLIAAAPDLLAALQHVVSDWDGGQLEDGEMPAIDAARRAIALVVGANA